VPFSDLISNPKLLDNSNSVDPNRFDGNAATEADLDVEMCTEG
jgi:hypothetical protein